MNDQAYQLLKTHKKLPLAAVSRIAAYDNSVPFVLERERETREFTSKLALGNLHVAEEEGLQYITLPAGTFMYRADDNCENRGGGQPMWFSSLNVASRRVATTEKKICKYRTNKNLRLLLVSESNMKRLYDIAKKGIMSFFRASKILEEAKDLYPDIKYENPARPPEFKSISDRWRIPRLAVELGSAYGVIDPFYYDQYLRLGRIANRQLSSLVIPLERPFYKTLKSSQYRIC